MHAGSGGRFRGSAGGSRGAFRVRAKGAAAESPTFRVTYGRFVDRHVGLRFSRS